jgi:hypothetical protein
MRSCMPTSVGVTCAMSMTDTRARHSSKSSEIRFAINPSMGKCILGLSEDPICPYGGLGVERVVPLVGQEKEVLGSCCAAHHTCCAWCD